MEVLILENCSPRSIEKAKLWARGRDDGQVFCATPVDRQLVLQGVRIQPISELSPTIDLESWDILHRLCDWGAADFAPVFSDSALREGIYKALVFTLPGVARTVAAAKHLTKNKVTVVTRWPGAVKACCALVDMSEPAVMGLHSPLRSIVSYLSPLVVAWRNVFRAALSLFVPRQGGFQRSKLLFLGQYATRVETYGDIFSVFSSKDVFFHIYQLGRVLPESKRRRLSDVVRAVQERGWNWVVYRDSNVGRQLIEVGIVALALTKVLLAGKNRELRLLMLRCGIDLRQWSFEIEDAMSKVGPKVLLTQQESSPRGPITAAVAKRFQCQVVNIFNGILSTYNPALKPPPFNAWIVWGAYQKELFQGKGVGVDRLHDLGHLSSKLWNEAKERRHLNLNGKSNKLVYFSQPPSPFVSDSRQAISEALKVFLRSVPEAQLVIKLHPLETDGFLQAAWADHPQATVLNASIAPGEVLVDSRLMITANSTVAVEAMYMQVPVLVFDAIRVYDDFAAHHATQNLYGKQDPAADVLSVWNSEEIRQKLVQCANERLKHHITPSEGDVTHAIGRVLQEYSSAGTVTG